MNLVRTIAAVLLALPFLIFGLNYFLHFFAMPEGGESPGDRLLQAIREGGLMKYIAFSHVVAAILLLYPDTRFLGALLQLPMVIGILSFHFAMLPSGVSFAAILLVLNVIVLVDPMKWRCLF